MLEDNEPMLMPVGNRLRLGQGIGMAEAGSFITGGMEDKVCFEGLG
jgi:hypothetical protein